VIVDRRVEYILYKPVLRRKFGVSVRPWLALPKPGSTNEILSWHSFANLLSMAASLKRPAFVGRSRIHGVTTKHFRGYPDAKRTGKHVAVVIAFYQSDFGPTDVWIDPDGRLARISMLVTDPSDSRQLRVTYDFFDYGVTFHVKPPLARNVDNPMKLSP
jgi:hypothetical protein